VSDNKELQHGREVSGNCADKIRHTLERFKRRLTLNNPRLVERYNKAELHLLVHIIPESGQEFVVSLQREVPELGGNVYPGHVGCAGCVGIAPEVPTNDLGFITWRHSVGFVLRSDSEQKAVLVGSVQCVEAPESIAIFPTLVWFGSVDSVYGILPHSLYFSHLSGLIFRGTVKHREIDMRMRARIARSEHNQPMGDVVKDAPEVLDCIANNDGNLGSDFGDTLHVERALHALRVILMPDSVLVGFKEGLAGKAKILDVLFGPFDLASDAV
jgi:hypothetical protein